jgi:hypothetical protein
MPLRAASSIRKRHAQKGELGGIRAFRSLAYHPCLLTPAVNLPYAQGMAFKALEQAYMMQDFAFNASMALKEALVDGERLRAPDKEQAQMIGTLSKAWRDAQEQIRIHRGKPLPGSLTHEKVKPSRTRASLSALSALAPAEDASEAAPAAPCVHGVAWQAHCDACDGAKGGS